jgi:hypothetical protein
MQWALVVFVPERQSFLPGFAAVELTGILEVKGAAEAMARASGHLRCHLMKECKAAVVS